MKALILEVYDNITNKNAEYRKSAIHRLTAEFLNRKLHLRRM